MQSFDVYVLLKYWEISPSPLTLYENIGIMSTIHQCKSTPTLHLKNIFEGYFYVVFSIYYEYLLKNATDSMW